MRAEELRGRVLVSREPVCVFREPALEGWVFEVSVNRANTVLVELRPTGMDEGGFQFIADTESVQAAMETVLEALGAKSEFLAFVRAEDEEAVDRSDSAAVLEWLRSTFPKLLDRSTFRRSSWLDLLLSEAGNDE
jgi:hypothetical protein